MGTVLPEPGDWNDAVRHSKEHPTHILGPYVDDDGQVQMERMGSGDPNEPSNCDFDTGSARTDVSRETSSGGETR